MKDSKDDLKKMLHANRQELERQEPRADLWDDIEAKLPVSQNTRVIPMKWMVAASIALVLGLLWWYQNGDAPEEILADEPKENSPMELPSEVAEVENYYSVQVNQKMNQLEKLDADQELMNEVENLKTEFESLKKEMGVGADNAVVVEAMIDNYRLRLNLLEDLLNAMDDQKTKENNYEREI